MTELVLDTNILLRFLLKDIPSQYDLAVKKIKQARKEKIKLIVPQIVIFEITYALIKGYGFEKDKVVKALKGLIFSKDLVVDDREIFTEALKMFKEKNLSLVDCFLYTYAKRIGTEVFTFDKALQKI